jgi:hypothetical protein
MSDEIKEPNEETPTPAVVVEHTQKPSPIKIILSEAKTAELKSQLAQSLGIQGEALSLPLSTIMVCFNNTDKGQKAVISVNFK